ncbi:oligosaccharide flippase family protein [uncultured Flavobacterium sp.]|uniref:oligosaccharide flippase family protein n=1 Tax=uncultured Flavobacterium sp. TaxID=165435 RepID=UPI0030CA271A
MFKSNQLFLNNFSIYFLGLISSGIISFITIPLIVKYYGIESYGRFSLVQNVILILISFGGGWLNQCVLRFNDYSTNFKFTIFQLYFIVLFPLNFICFSILSLMENGVLIPILGTITMFLGSFVALSIVFYQSKFNARKTFYFDFIRILIFVSMVLFFNYVFYQTSSLLKLISSFFISYLISFFFLLRIDFKFFKISVNLFIKRFNKNYFKAFFKQNNYLLHYGWPLAFWFTISSILNVSDRYIIDYYLTDKELGTYSAIYDLLYKGVSLLYAPILVAGFPIISQKYNSGNKKEAMQFLKKLILLEALIFIIIAFTAFFLKGFFLEKIVGIIITDQSLELIMPIIFGAFIWQLAVLVHKPLELELRTKTMLLFSIIALLVNLLLNIIFIPKYGIVFASYTTFVSALVYLLLSVFYISYRNKKKICGT